MKEYKIENVTERAINGEFVKSYDVVFDTPLEMMHYIISKENAVDFDKLVCEVSDSVDSGNDSELFYDFLRIADEIQQTNKFWTRIDANGTATIFGDE